MPDAWTSRLSEYLDDELPPSTREELEQHLVVCDECRRTLAELREVVQRAATLPDHEPEADLWPAVSARVALGRVVPIERARRRISFTLPQLVAAAATLVLVTVGGMWLALAGPDARIPSAAVAPAAIATPVAFDPRGRADSAIAELERVLQQERANLDSSTVRILAQNLAVIDRAIAQARAALASDPGNPYLNEHLARTMRKKMDVLRQAAQLAAVAS